ncbi:MAG: hypothetical protein GX660_08070 [Clostridiaceae bacterium]|nr:hypothetical protein [Clostridiaceae bacterium]
MNEIRPSSLIISIVLAVLLPALLGIGIVKFVTTQTKSNTYTENIIQDKNPIKEVVADSSIEVNTPTNTEVSTPTNENLIKVSENVEEVEINESQIIDSFITYLNMFFESYKTNNREWVNDVSDAYQSPTFLKISYNSPLNYKYDIKKTDSLVNPYIGICEFSLIVNRTKEHITRKSALSDNNFISSETEKNLHKHTYSYQNGEWMLLNAEYYSYTMGKWYKCSKNCQ